MKKTALIFLLFFSFSLVFSQEFKATVSVSSSQLEGTDKRVFQSLQKALYEFVNERAWTNYKFSVEERIECTFVLSVQERISSDEFRGRLNVVYRRPVYKTSYDTPMLNYIDNDIRFQYMEGQPLEYSDNTFSSNLTSLYAFYIYMILGIDFDSYKLFGGNPYFEKAQSVVNSAQNAVEPGWKSFESMRNRYWMAENILNSSYSSMRQFMYKYHRQGLDVMSDNLEMGRSTIALSLEDLRKANRAKPGLFFLKLILDAKRDEMRNVFMEASPMEKTKVVNILKEIDPSNSSVYQKILTDKP
jgi:hypothetical protein